MKKLLLLLLAFPLVFGACSDDDKEEDQKPPVTAKLEGTWLISSSTVKAATDKEEATKEIEAAITKGFPKAGDVKYELNANKTFTLYKLSETGFEKDEDGTYAVKDNVITFTYTEKVKEEAAPRQSVHGYSLKENSLQLTTDKTKDVVANEKDFYYNSELYPDLKVTSVVLTQNYNREVKK